MVNQVIRLKRSGTIPGNLWETTILQFTGMRCRALFSQGALTLCMVCRKDMPQNEPKPGLMHAAGLCAVTTVLGAWTRVIWWVALDVLKQEAKYACGGITLYLG